MRKLAVTGLHKAFGSHPVLTGLDLEVPAGSFTAILGPSGSGKTTLLRLLAGFERADAGTIEIGDRVVDGPATGYVPPERRQIGYVPQEGALFPHLTVAANVGFGLPARQRRGPRTTELLTAVGLAGMGNRYPHQLSGGQQQRVALARALITQPRVLLLDEPLSALDPFLRIKVRAELKRLQKELGISFVHVTHSQDEAMALADLIVVMNHGHIEQAGTPRDVFNAPHTAFVAQFIGGHNVIATDQGKIAVRADRLKLRPSGQQRLPAVVRGVEYQGTHVSVTLAALDAELTATLNEAEFDAVAVQPGQEVAVDWSDNDIHRLSEAA